MLAQFIFNGFASGCQIIPFAFAFWLIYGIARFVDVSQAGLFALAGYLFLGAVNSGAPAMLGLLASVVAVVAVGAASEYLVFRPLRRRAATATVLLVASIALYSVITNGIAIAYGNETRVLQASVSPAASVGPILISNSQVLQLVSAGILVAIWMRVYFGSRIGLYVRAAAQDPVLYESFGLNLPQLRTFSFFTASAMVAAAACTFSIDAGVTPERGMPALLDAVTATLLGGTSSATGPILGAIALGCLKGLVGWQLSEQWEPVLTLGLLVVLLVARPSGLRALIGRAV